MFINNSTRSDIDSIFKDTTNTALRTRGCSREVRGSAGDTLSRTFPNNVLYLRVARGGREKYEADRPANMPKEDTSHRKVSTFLYVSNAEPRMLAVIKQVK